jgi:SAM-dependent methyltransferase
MFGLKKFGVVLLLFWTSPQLIATLTSRALCCPAYGASDRALVRPTVDARQLANVAHSLGAGDSYAPISSLIFGNESSGSAMTVFEENALFTYAVGKMALPESNSASNKAPSAHLVRRVIALKPSIIVVDDQVVTVDGASPEGWRLCSAGVPRVSGRKGEVQEPTGDVSWETLLPATGVVRSKPSFGGESRCVNLTIETTNRRTSPPARFIHVFEIRPHGAKNMQIESALAIHNDQTRLTVSARNRTFQMALPTPDQGGGTIEISTANHKTVLKNRLFAAGVLPHGPEGTSLLELWDSEYRRSRPPMWDIGRPADELVKVVTEGKVQPGRVVDICCGSGSDAIYLAGKGFDVTGIDIAPTALAQAQRKAAAAGVSVQWLLADVLRPPQLKPFDFIYDRGCYHVVRDQNLPAYLETVRGLSHPGTKLLLLASRVNEHEANATTSGVTEEEIRNDFLESFDLEWLREVRLESNKEEGHADPPGWSALFTRKEER